MSGFRTDHEWIPNASCVRAGTCALRYATLRQLQHRGSSIHDRNWSARKTPRRMDEPLRGRFVGVL